MHQYFCMSVAHFKIFLYDSPSQKRDGYRKNIGRPLFTCTHMDIFSSKGNNINYITPKNVLEV